MYVAMKGVNKQYDEDKLVQKYITTIRDQSNTIVILKIKYAMAFELHFYRHG